MHAQINHDLCLQLVAIYSSAHCAPHVHVKIQEAPENRVGGWRKSQRKGICVPRGRHAHGYGRDAASDDRRAAAHVAMISNRVGRRNNPTHVATARAPPHAAPQHVSRCPRAHSNPVARPPATSTTAPAAHKGRPLLSWSRAAPTGDDVGACVRDMSGARARDEDARLDRPSSVLPRGRHHDRHGRRQEYQFKVLRREELSHRRHNRQPLSRRPRLRKSLHCLPTRKLDVRDRTHDNI